jgi:hypothetical protein
MRVVLRQQDTGLYLQPSDAWDSNRDTAREFASAAVAYSWALESRLKHSEVVLAFAEPPSDFVCIRVDAVANRPKINCQDAEWSFVLYSTLQNGIEVDLINFDNALHGDSCKSLARAFDLSFSMNGDSQAKIAHFRKNADWTLCNVQA